MKCRICEHVIQHAPVVGRDLLHDPNRTFQYHRCDKCGCFQIDSVPDDMSPFYGDFYYSLHGDPYDQLSWLGKCIETAKDQLIFHAARPINQLLHLPSLNRKWVTMLKWEKQKRILDVGCGNGILLRRLYRLGFRNLTGADAFVDSDVCIGDECWIRKATMEELTGKFDIIVLSHSLEHMEDQHGSIRSIKRLLAPGGKVLIMIPIFSDYFFKKYGDCWYSWDIPRHFFLHSLQSFTQLVEGAGLKVSRYVYYSFLNCIVESERRLAKFSDDKLADERLRTRSHSDWMRELDRINTEGDSDCCNFLLTHRDE